MDGLKGTHFSSDQPQPLQTNHNSNHRDGDREKEKKEERVGTLGEEDGKLETDEARNWKNAVAVAVAVAMRISLLPKKEKNSLMLCSSH